MKLHAIQDRSASRSQKRSSDALDLYRLLLQLDADGSIHADLASAPDALRSAVRAATQWVLIDDATRTRGWLSASDDLIGRVSADELRYLAQPVVDALTWSSRKTIPDGPRRVSSRPLRSAYGHL